MKKFRKLSAAALAVVFTALPGCSVLLDDDTWTYEEQSSYTQETSSQVTYESAAGYGAWRPQGSANTLEGESVIVTILLETPDADFTDDEITYANESIDRSCRYLEEQGKKYGKSVRLYNYDSENSDLLFRISCDKHATDAADFRADTYT